MKEKEVSTIEDRMNDGFSDIRFPISFAEAWEKGEEITMEEMLEQLRSAKNEKKES